MSIESRIAALLRSPRALGFLAALSGRDVSQVPRLADVGFTPVTSWTVDIEEPLPPTPPADADGRQHELSPQFSAILDDPFSLVTLAASTVSDWSWNPRARAAQRYLLRNADSYHLLAQYLSTSTASDWWWGPVELTRQTIVSSATNRPSIDQAEKLAKAHLCSGSPKLFHGAMLTSSTSLGAQLPAVQLCDPDVTHRLREPVHCWRATIDSNARVCELGRPSDWLRLCERYPLSYPPPVEWRSWGGPGEGWARG